MRTARIRARIQEIQVQMARDHGRDLDVLIGKLEVVYRRAIGDHHFTAAARAVELQARLARMASAPRSSRPALFPAPVLQEAGSGVTDQLGADQKTATGIKQEARTCAKAPNYNEPGK